MIPDLPPIFIGNINAAFGDDGRTFLQDLPRHLQQAARRWELTLGEPFLLSYNYVCRVTDRDGRPAVLKLGVPNPELTSEINTLRLYDGQGACRLYAADAQAGMMLLERLQPGTMLTEVSDDDQATRIAATLLKRIQRPLPIGDGFLSLRKWFNDLQRLRPRFNGTTGPFPEKTVDIVEGMLAELFAEDRPQLLLHGDFHHYNILLSERGWLVIDPKGVAGAAEYEVGPFLINPIEQILDEPSSIRRTRRRMDILSEQLGFDPQRLWRWAVCHTLLSAWWDIAEDGSINPCSLAWPEIMLKAGLSLS